MNGKDFVVKIDYISVDDVKLYKNNPRNNDEAVEVVAKSIKEFGLKQPIVLDKNNEVVVGHTRFKALLSLGAKKIPFIRADDLSEEQVKAYRIMDNKSNEFASLDNDLLNLELKDLKSKGFDVELTGFDDLDITNLDFNETGYKEKEVMVENKPIMKVVFEKESDFRKLEDDLRELIKSKYEGVSVTILGGEI